jgi:hypothetical protein
MGQIVTKFMPHFLSKEQDNHVNTCHDKTSLKETQK